MDRARKLQLATVAAITLFAATAEAARVVVLEVRGEDDSAFEEMLVDAIKGEHDVVESRAFDRAARREGVGDDLDARSIAKVARSLEAVAVLDSILARRDGEWELTVRVRGKDGLVKKKMKVSLDAPRLGNKGKQKVAKQLLGVLDEVLTTDRGKKARGRDDDDGEEDVRARSDQADEAPRGKKARGRADRDDADRDDRDDGDRDDRSARSRRDRDDDDDGDRDRARGDRDRDDDADADDDERDDDRGRRDRVARADDDDEDASLDEDLDDDLRPRRGKKGRRELRRYGILVEGGLSGMQRKLAFTSRDFEEAPKGYPGSMVPAAHVAAEVYPLAITNPKSVAGGLGVFVEYDRVTSLTTRTSTAPDVALPTRQTRWTVGGKLRYNFGKAPNLPSIVAGVGYGRRTFIVDRTPLPDGAALDLPDVDYRLIEPSLTLRVPVGTERVAFSLGARGLFFRSAGQIQTADSYGAAKLTGVDAELGLDAAVTRMVMLRLHGSYTNIGYDFIGNGAESNGRDGNLTTQDVGGASDKWMAAGASIAVVY